MGMTDRQLLELIASKVGNIETRVDSIETKVDSIEVRVSAIETRMDNFEARMDNLEARMDNTDAKITDIQLTLENETNKNIQIIAEGHLDLIRKLDDALKAEQEKEMLMIRVNRLENELRKLKNQVEAIA